MHRLIQLNRSLDDLIQFDRPAWKPGYRRPLMYSYSKGDLHRGAWEHFTGGSPTTMATHDKPSQFPVGSPLRKSGMIAYPNVGASAEYLKHHPHLRQTYGTPENLSKAMLRHEIVHSLLEPENLTRGNVKIKDSGKLRRLPGESRALGAELFRGLKTPLIHRIRSYITGMRSLSSRLDSLIQFDRDYKTVAKDAAIGGVTSAAGTAGLLAGAGLLLKHKAPDLGKMLGTASKQHIKVFNPIHTIPMMRSLPEASRLFGKQLRATKAVEDIATRGRDVPLEHIQKTIRETGIQPEQDIKDISAFKNKWGRSPGETMEKSVGLLSGMAATGVGVAGGAALSKGWKRSDNANLSALLDDLIEFNVTRSTWETYREHVFKDGRRINIDKLMGRVKSRPVKSVPIKDLSGYDRSKRTGFSLKRLANADTRVPILIDPEGGVLDGRHRIIKHQSEGHRKIKAIRVTDKDIKATEFSVAKRLFNKVKEIQFKALHQPGKQDEPPETIPKLEGVVDYTVQRHAAKRAGLHRDVRIGTRRHGLLSWATRKDLPAEGAHIGIHPQPVHSHDYLGWEGDIPSGYGAGQVSTEQLGKALITKSTPTEVHATLADQREHHRLAFLKTAKGWLLARGKHPEPPTEAQKPKYKSVSQEEAPEQLASLEPGSIVQPKVDGALVYVTTKGNRPEIFSHRKSKISNKNVIHTERFFHGRPTTNIPKEHQRTLLGELYGTRGDKAIEPQELGGILNTHIGESIQKQKTRGIKLKIMPFDYANGKGETYPERLAKVKKTLQYLPRSQFHPPEEARTPGVARRLFDKIRKGRHPLTKEGVIIHPPTGKMIKIKNVEEENVKIHSVFPGKGKLEGSHGGFYYADESGKPLGRVGTGMTEETRRDLPRYIGRTARVRYQEKFKSGKLRAPSLVAIEENK